MNKDPEFDGFGSQDGNAYPTLPPIDESRERRHLALVAFSICIYFVATYLFQALLHSLLIYLFPTLVKQSWYLMLISTLPLYIFGLPCSFLLLRTAKAAPPKQNKLGVLPLIGLIPLCFALMYLGNIIGQVINSLIGAITGNPPQNELTELTVNTPLWANLLCVGILAPIMEELFYRKLIIDRLRRYGDLPAVLISGLLFGLIHGNFSQFFYAALTGIVFAIVYLRTGRLRYTIFLHMTVNLIGGVFVTEVVRRLDLEALGSGELGALLQNPVSILLMLLYFCFIGVCFVIAPITLALVWKHIRLQKSEHPLSPAQWCRTALLNPSVWFLLALLIFLFAL